MLSVLIPTYNYNIFSLVEELHKQCTLIDELQFEIIVIEDGSTLYTKENNQIITLKNCKHICLKYNIGRSAVRNLLAEKAAFTHLLFLDADVRLISPDFINKYLLYCNKPNSVVFGGCSYHDNSYSRATSLRFHFGKKREAISSFERNKKPFKYILSANFLILKSDFLLLNIPNTNAYGMDNYFSYLLNIHNKKIIHIDNSVWHCGLEENQVFLEKSLKSAQLRKENWLVIKNFSNNNTLLKTYNKFNFFPLNSIFGITFKIIGPFLKKLFFKPQPNLRAFDLYRLLYLFKLK
ncbi:glycosyltransferase family 2 protein [Flavobacterium sp. xlx-214]|uniref:glycosyltransferase family 2 protein n=1 Tax=unclassified Flavobacterium TaxID=196869 RepID=UPI0013D17871|nr:MULTISPECIES: glycosyltransferase family 2 protein [unclassified Flavobacterium]MBA5791370.1 glycosyltransferase family 2 protein [Flavobacterium sp. xlx-221]QMI83478.1 glycosyltransferase family 2 protein [Flavobacterium sp. xlx-214]